MARPTAPEKEPGRIKQMWQVFQMTRRYDSNVVWLLALSFLAPVGLGVVAALLLSPDNILFFVLWIISGILLGVLLALIVLSRRAERAAFSQIEGQAGAVGAVLRSGLRRSYTASEMPVNVSPRTRDAVYRAVGKGGVVLIAEGPASRTRPMVEKERANVRRVLPSVPVHVINVGPDADAVALHRLYPTMAKYKKALNRAEVQAVSNRLASLGKQPGGIGIPKGMDPMKMRAPRPR